jgi:hypothetical protein
MKTKMTFGEGPRGGSMTRMAGLILKTRMTMTTTTSTLTMARHCPFSPEPKYNFNSQMQQLEMTKGESTPESSFHDL